MFSFLIIDLLLSNEKMLQKSTQHSQFHAANMGL